MIAALLIIAAALTTLLVSRAILRTLNAAEDKKEPAMNCPKCNHSSVEHRARGCYHAHPSITYGLCDCDMTPDQIELDALKSENARLRAALEKYADEDNWSAIDGYIQLWNANDYGPKQAAEALQGQAE